VRRWLFAELNSTLQGVDSTLHHIVRTLERMDQRMDREFKLTRGSVENNTRVTREILVELREQRPILEHIGRGVQSNTEGLLHVLGELRNGRGGPGTAPAA
jgi:hypothetical protein